MVVSRAMTAIGPPLGASIGKLRGLVCGDLHELSSLNEKNIRMSGVKLDAGGKTKDVVAFFAPCMLAHFPPIRVSQCLCFSPLVIPSPAAEAEAM